MCRKLLVVSNSAHRIRNEVENLVWTKHGVDVEIVSHEALRASVLKDTALGHRKRRSPRVIGDTKTLMLVLHTDRWSVDPLRIRNLCDTLRHVVESEDGNAMLGPPEIVEDLFVHGSMPDVSSFVVEVDTDNVFCDLDENEKEAKVHVRPLCRGMYREALGTAKESSFLTKTLSPFALSPHVRYYFVAVSITILLVIAAFTLLVFGHPVVERFLHAPNVVAA